MAIGYKLKSRDELNDWMLDRGETNSSLAMQVHIKTRQKCSVALIAHLRRGARTYCTPERARAIEDVLTVRRGDLFLREVIDGSQAVGRSA
ncbi:hypothetical protein [Rhodococcus sp. NPDC006774]|uniref:hypothetical protein n=1 Tax=Rhodococcus sp. NPDC006774 TaxID=3157186 RepID=UPI0033E7CC65